MDFMQVRFSRQNVNPSASRVAGVLRLSLPPLLTLVLLLLALRTTQAHEVAPAAPPLLPACYQADLRCTLPSDNHIVHPGLADSVLLVTDTRPLDGKWLRLMPGLLNTAHQPIDTPQPLFDVPCVDGFADVFPCHNVDLLAYLPIGLIGGQTNNDSWGWRDPVDGREYALVGANDGMVVLDITTPTAPFYLGKLPSHGTVSSWRDLKVYRDYVFVVADYNRNHGMQVFDLRKLGAIDRATAPVLLQEDAHYAEFDDAHNIVINAASGYAYAVGTDTCDGGLHIIDIRTPTAPRFVACYQDDGYIHDAQCVLYHGPDGRYQGHEICINASVDALSVVDVTDKMAPQRIGAVHNEDSAYIHQSWLSEDQRYVVMNDEMDEWYSGQNTRSYMVDVQQLDTPRVIGTYTAALPAIDHNLYISDTYLYEANYTSGLRVLDGKALAQGRLHEVAFFDTFPDHDEAIFSGAWNAYPYFRNGTVLVSTLDRGIFLLKPRLTPDVLVSTPTTTVRACRTMPPAPLALPFTVQPRNGYTQTVTLTTVVEPPLVEPITPPTQLSVQNSTTLSGNVQLDLRMAVTGPYTVTITAEVANARAPAAAVIALHLAMTTPPATTQLTATAPLATLPPTVAWVPTPATAAYQVEVAADARFTQLLMQTTTTTAHYTLPQPLALNRTYWWRVTPLNGCGAGPATAATLSSASGLFLPIIHSSVERGQTP